MGCFGYLKKLKFCRSRIVGANLQGHIEEILETLEEIAANPGTVGCHLAWPCK
jgi:hypothetical protein